MRYSIVLPYYDPEYKKVQMFTYLIESIVKCSEGYNYELVIVKDGRSYVESHNRGLRNATGDHIIVVNDDVLIQDKDWLKKLTKEGIAGHLKEEDGFPDAVLWGFPRSVIEKIGYMDERYKDGFNFEDTDYFRTAKEAGISFHEADVKHVHHKEGTRKAYGDEERHAQMVAANKKLFKEKWHEE